MAANIPVMADHARRIVVGYDDSRAARRALDRAAALAGYGSTLTVVSVAQDASSNGKALENAREHLVRGLVSATYVEPVGEPAEELVEAARELDADLLVVGRRNGNSLRHRVLGSVSAKVVRNAPCDVLVIR